MTPIDEALDLYRRRRMARERAFAAMQAVQGIAGLVAPGTLLDVKRAFRTTDWELNACTSDPTVRSLLKQARANGVELNEPAKP